jgi:hypothetical protein
MISAPIVGVRDAIVDGVDVDAVAVAVRRCSGVEDMIDGPPAAAATYLPGRRVDGVRVDSEAVAVQVRARWGYSVPEIAAQIQAATAPLAPRRRVDVIVAELGDPPRPAAGPTGAPVTTTRAAARDQEEPWMSNKPVSGRRGGHSLAPTIPIAAATRTPSSPA